MMRLEIFNEQLARHWVRIDKVEFLQVIQFFTFSNWSSCTHETWSIASLDGYSYRLEEERFGAPFTIDFADFVPQIFKELNSVTFLLLIADCTAPFIVDVFTDATIDGVAPTAAAPARGLCLEYQQLPC